MIESLKLTWALLIVITFCALPLRAAENEWVPAGWGGGGFYYAAAFDPKNDGVLYLGGDVNGVYKSEDHGKSWRIINNGLTAYGVFALAVDPSNPQIVWAATDEGLSKSTDGGNKWVTIKNSDRKALRLTGEKNKSFHNVAIDPTNSNVVYVGTPHGKIYKTTDGGETWTPSYAKSGAGTDTPSMQMQFGGVNGAIFGGFWMPVTFPKDASPSDVIGMGFTLQSNRAQPKDGFFTIRTSTGFAYRSHNLHDDLAKGPQKDVILQASDFVVDPEFKKKDPEKAAQAPATPEWAAVNRFDFACVGGVESEPAQFEMGRIFFATQNSKITAIDLAATKTVNAYGNWRVGAPVDGPISVVAVSPKEPNVLAAASADEGVLLSTDAGQSWRAVGSVKKAASVAFSASDPNILYAACRGDQIWKSTDKGATWANASGGIDPKAVVLDVVVSPTNPDEVSAIASEGWNGRFLWSTDGGKSWSANGKLKGDPIADPTLPGAADKDGFQDLSGPRNLAMNPQNPKELYIAANWRSAISSDGGRTWNESVKGADISCVADIRFYKDRVYACAMDEGVLESRDNGATWKQLWPLKHNWELSGHYWRLDIREVDGNVRVLSTSSPWDRQYNQVVISNDDGKTFKAHRSGLPDYLPTANTMWGRSFARALAVDPTDPKVVYVGLDGDATPGKSGGGVFKSTDGGQTWNQLASQPGSRRMFFGLAVDPTDNKRLYWGACAENGGVYRSDDGGESWKQIFKQDQWIFNLHVTADGTLYVPGKQIWKSTDHGETWKALGKFPLSGGTIVGFEIHPTDPNTMWAAANWWGNHADGHGGVFKTTDGGQTWTDITGNLPHRKPLVLRFNPATSELWAGYVGIYKIKQ